MLVGICGLGELRPNGPPWPNIQLPFRLLFCFFFHRVSLFCLTLHINSTSSFVILNSKEQKQHKADNFTRSIRQPSPSNVSETHRASLFIHGIRSPFPSPRSYPARWTPAPTGVPVGESIPQISLVSLVPLLKLGATPSKGLFEASESRGLTQPFSARSDTVGLKKMGVKGFVEGGIASIVAGCSPHPLDLVKVRMQLHGESAAPKPELQALRPALAFQTTSSAGGSRWAHRCRREDRPAGGRSRPVLWGLRHGPQADPLLHHSHGPLRHPQKEVDRPGDEHPPVDPQDRSWADGGRHRCCRREPCRRGDGPDASRWSAPSSRATELPERGGRDRPPGTGGGCHQPVAGLGPHRE